MVGKARSPGPAAYNIKSTVCDGVPAFSFGTMKRPAPNFKGISPGPVYQLKASLGKGKDQTFRSMPAFGFGTGERPDPAGNSKLRELSACARPRCCALGGAPTRSASPAAWAHRAASRTRMNSLVRWDGPQTEHQARASMR